MDYDDDDGDRNNSYNVLSELVNKYAAYSQ